MSLSAAPAHTISLDGERKTRRNLTGTRIRLMTIGLFLVFAIIAARLIQLAEVDASSEIEGQTRDQITATRPAILDRNGIEMAVDIRVPSLYAEPRRIIDIEEAVQKLTGALPDIDPQWLRQRLTGSEGFVWIKREMTPQQEERILRLGIPGIDFLTESKRFYPGGEEASHLLGIVNVDNQGIAGFERYVDSENVAVLQEFGFARDRELQPVRMSIDMRVQHAMREQLLDALTRYQAMAAAGVMMDVETGEIVALVSLPDFNPNEPATAIAPYNGKKDARINRITAGRFELGSTFKTITFAAALDSGKVTLDDKFDARFPIRFGKYSIDDFHGKHTILSVPEIYKYSSNIGTIGIMQAMGSANYRAFIKRLGFDDPLPVELPEKTISNIPAKFSEIVAATASFGHGLSVTPLHMVAAVSALVNGGNYVPPTLYPRSAAEAQNLYRRVIAPATSDEIRSLMRLNALEGSGTRADKFSEGYRIGGKTGTAEKVVDGKYVTDNTLAVFASAFPLESPKYAMVILVDEPQAENEQAGRTAGWNAGEVSGRIVQRVAPMLGVFPDFDETIDTALVPDALR